MARIGYHCSHEQHAPGALLAHARAAERAGFAHAMCSDHLMPWSAEGGQGHSGFAWTWLGAALQATTLTFGTVNAPGQRYHPVVIAHAIATLGVMFPGRFWVALGTGEALNEHVTGEPWPAKAARRARLRECVDVIRALLRGETVSHDGHVRVAEAQLYERPAVPPPLFGAALTVETARWLGAWADGLATMAQPPAQLRALIEAFHAGGGAGKPVYVQAPIAYAATDAEAVQTAGAWKFAALPDPELKADLAHPRAFDAAVAGLTSEDLRRAIRISASADEHAAWIAGDLASGADRVYVHHVGATTAQQERFLDRVAPALLRL